MGEGEEYETVVVVDGPGWGLEGVDGEYEDKGLVNKNWQGWEAWIDFDVAAVKVVGWGEAICPREGGWGEEWKENLVFPGLWDPGFERVDQRYSWKELKRVRNLPEHHHHCLLIIPNPHAHPLPLTI